MKSAAKTTSVFGFARLRRIAMPKKFQSSYSKISYPCAGQNILSKILKVNQTLETSKRNINLKLIDWLELKTGALIFCICGQKKKILFRWCMLTLLNLASFDF